MRRKIPVIRQMTSSACGAACLAMVLASHGKSIPLAQVAEVCQPGRDGLSALTIMQAGRHLGLRGRGLRVELDSLGEISVPAILHWGFNHFVVLERWNGNKGSIIDPESGRRDVTRDELDMKFTGVAITFEPAADFGASTSRHTSPWKRHIMDAVRASGVRSRMVQVVGASLALALIGLAVPLLTRALVNEVIPVRDDDILAILVIFVAMTLLGYFVMAIARGFLTVWLHGKISSQLTLNFYEHTLSLPFRYFQQRGSGDLMVRLTSNMTIQNLLTQQTLGALLDSLLVIAYATIMVFIAWQFGLIAILIGLLLLAVAALAIKPTHRLMQQDLEAQSMSEGFLVESLTGIETLKSTGTERNALDRWSDLFFTQLNLTLRRGRLDAIVSAVTTTIVTMAPIVLLLVGGFLVIREQISLGTMLALQGMAGLFLGPLSRILGQLQQLQLAGAHLERIGDVVDASPESADFGTKVLSDFTGRITFENVSFTYSTSSPNIVEGLNLDIKPGSKIALVGASGSGKSTFAKLVLGLLSPTGGEIRYDGIAQKDLDIVALRGNFGAVIQSATVFAGSIRSNIAFSDPQLPMEEIITAAKRAGLSNDIDAMPMGYETIISESGTVLSGGQRQRLAMARALVSDPTLLVLDEATSHLDAVTEAHVMKSLQGLSSTKIICAHRLSTIVDADEILVFDSGKIVQRGTHKDLVSQEGTYQDLVHNQLLTTDSYEERTVL